jgi:AhpC/TSA family
VRFLTAIDGTEVPLPDPDRLIHLQFRRFAGCPVCNLHLRSVVARHDEILAAGIREVVVFHSSREELRKHADDLPFDVIADPGKELYREFGVESRPRALLDPRVWLTIVRAVAADLPRALRKEKPLPNVEGGRLGLPADFLIATDGRTVASRFGEHAYDQWSVDELLALVPTPEVRP